MPSSFFLPKPVSAPLVWCAYVWLGLWFFVIVLLAATDLAQLAATPRALAMDVRGDGSRAAAPPQARRSPAIVALASIGLGISGLAREGSGASG